MDHRSLEDQNILREPQKHLGPIATEIERDGRASHRGDENRAIEARNGSYLDLETAEQKVAAKIEFEQRKFAHWAEQKRRGLVLDQEKQAERFEGYLGERMERLEESLDVEFGRERDELQREHAEVSARTKSPWWRKFIRDITGRSRKDREEMDRIESEQRRIQEEEAKRLAAEKGNQDRLRAQKSAQDAREQAKLQKSLQKAEQARAAQNWAMGKGKGVQKPPAPPEPANDTVSDETPARKPKRGQGAAAKFIRERAERRGAKPLRDRDQGREEVLKSRLRRPMAHKGPDKHTPNIEKIKRATKVRQEREADDRRDRDGPEDPDPDFEP